jgi:7,8-dihydro-6-hydroxymethylpterin-pyrophosphokinase
MIEVNFLVVNKRRIYEDAGEVPLNFSHHRNFILVMLVSFNVQINNLYLRKLYRRSNQISDN